MNDTLPSQLAQIQRMLESLREDAAELADLVADEVWDNFESEIDQATENGFIFDMASNIRVALSSALSLGFDTALERHVLRRIESLSAALNAVAPGAGDTASAELKGIRKGIKLWQKANGMIDEAIELAKPGLIGMLFLARDPASDAWDREMEGNPARVRKNLLLSPLNST